MLAMTMREHRGYVKCRCRVTRWKARVYAGRRHMAAEEGVGEIAGRWDVRRTQPPCRHLHNYVNDGAVSVRFTGEQRGLFRVGIMAGRSHNQKGPGKSRDFR